MSSFLAKLKNPLVVGYVVVVLLLLVGATYVTVMYLNTDKNKKTATDSKPAIAAPATVQKDLKSANASAQKAYDLHNNAGQAINEQQVKLSE